MNRTEPLCRVLGWQGGTIHQIAEETGCDVQSLLYAKPDETNLASDYSSGWFAARTNTLPFNQRNIFPKYKGNLDFWLGAAEGMRLKLSGI